ncbi:hypothetical protein BOTBODRAFT_195661 [Botryobasidium botryosum FD-172 SS1]|uniref:Uncharacterized protein n=1 Tax=Botryobasidium botryosum (strain FD-172 SS1) TaxID=930990 RepID=A0A067N2M9_BOTB1|nr:hypothetical protein BOTBODRAFT_195661 [Botryobasidium botryosum FD-172 SS1]
MEASLSGPALVWYFAQEDDVRTNFNKLRIAMLKQFGGLAGGRSAPTQGPPQEPSTDTSSAAADPAPAPSPTLASVPEKEPTPPPRPPEPVPPRRGRLWVQSHNGTKRANEGYVSRNVSAKKFDAWVCGLTQARDKDNHLIVEILERPDKSIRLISTGTTRTKRRPSFSAS